MRARFPFRRFLLGAALCGAASPFWPAASEPSHDLPTCLISASTEMVFQACSAVIADGRESPENLAKAHLNRAKTWWVPGRYDPERAMADYDAAIRLDPSSGEAFEARGTEWHHRGDLDRAIADFTEAIRLGSGRPGHAHQRRGIAWRDKGDFERAIADFDHAIQREKGDINRATAIHERGIALRAKRDLDRAILDFDEVIRLNWQVESAYADRGWAWLLKGDARKAIGDFGAVFAKMENKATFAYVLYGRGFSRTHTGDQAGGDADIAAAQAIDRRLVQELAKLGPALLKGDAKKSAADFDDVFKRLYDRFALASALYGRGLLRIGWGDPVGGKTDIAAAKTIDPKIAEDVVRLRLN